VCCCRGAFLSSTLPHSQTPRAFANAQQNNPPACLFLLSEVYFSEVHLGLSLVVRVLSDCPFRWSEADFEHLELSFLKNLFFQKKNKEINIYLVKKNAEHQSKKNRESNLKRASFLFLRCIACT
jgi:hypothetical protein